MGIQSEPTVFPDIRATSHGALPEIPVFKNKNYSLFCSGANEIRESRVNRRGITMGPYLSSKGTLSTRGRGKHQTSAEFLLWPLLWPAAAQGGMCGSKSALHKDGSPASWDHAGSVPCTALMSLIQACTRHLPPSPRHTLESSRGLRELQS